MMISVKKHYAAGLMLGAALIAMPAFAKNLQINPYPLTPAQAQATVPPMPDFQPQEAPAAVAPAMNIQERVIPLQEITPSHGNIDSAEAPYHKSMSMEDPLAVSADSAPVEIEWTSQTAEPVADMSAAQDDRGLAVYGWQAQQGSDLKLALIDWSRSAGVTLVWNIPENYQIASNLSVEGSYEEAVQTLLDDYAGQSVRPVGSLYIDPADGRRVLIIESYQ